MGGRHADGGWEGGTRVLSIGLARPRARHATATRPTTPHADCAGAGAAWAPRGAFRKNPIIIDPKLVGGLHGGRWCARMTCDARTPRIRCVPSRISPQFAANRHPALENGMAEVRCAARGVLRAVGLETGGTVSGDIGVRPSPTAAVTRVSRWRSAIDRPPDVWAGGRGEGAARGGRAGGAGAESTHLQSDARARCVEAESRHGCTVERGGGRGVAKSERESEREEPGALEVDSSGWTGSRMRWYCSCSRWFRSLPDVGGFCLRTRV